MRYLVLDDSPTARATLVAAVRAARPGAEVVEVQEVWQLLRAARQQAFDCVFVDMLLSGGLNGLDAIRQLKEEHPGGRVVLVTGLSPMHPDVAAARSEKPLATLAKPVAAHDIRRILDAAEGADADAPDLEGTPW